MYCVCVLVVCVRVRFWMGLSCVFVCFIIASVVVGTVASVIVVGFVVKRKFVRVHFCGESASRDIK